MKGEISSEENCFTHKREGNDVKKNEKLQQTEFSVYGKADLKKHQ